jgi:hypothetical protein
MMSKIYEKTIISQVNRNTDLANHKGWHQKSSDNLDAHEAVYWSECTWNNSSNFNNKKIVKSGSPLPTCIPLLTFKRTMNNLKYEISLVTKPGDVRELEKSLYTMHRTSHPTNTGCFVTCLL